MRQSLVTVGFFVGILILPIAVAACGDSLTKAHQASANQAEVSVDLATVTPETMLVSVAAQ